MKDRKPIPCICDNCKEELKEVKVIVKDTKTYVVCKKCKGDLNK